MVWLWFYAPCNTKIINKEAGYFDPAYQDQHRLREKLYHPERKTETLKEKSSNSSLLHERPKA